jgi:hypothetical protein
MVMRECVDFLIARGDYNAGENKVQIARQLFSDCKSQKEVMKKINTLMGDLR